MNASERPEAAASAYTIRRGPNGPLQHGLVADHRTANPADQAHARGGSTPGLRFQAPISNGHSTVAPGNRSTSSARPAQQRGGTLLRRDAPPNRGRQQPLVDRDEHPVSIDERLEPPGDVGAVGRTDPGPGEQLRQPSCPRAHRSRRPRRRRSRRGRARRRSRGTAMCRRCAGRSPARVDGRPARPRPTGASAPRPARAGG